LGRRVLELVILRDNGTGAVVEGATCRSFIHIGSHTKNARQHHNYEKVTTIEDFDLFNAVLITEACTITWGEKRGFST
jgi:hypothetical protein